MTDLSKRPAQEVGGREVRSGSVTSTVEQNQNEESEHHCQKVGTTRELDSRIEIDQL